MVMSDYPANGGDGDECTPRGDILGVQVDADGKTHGFLLIRKSRKKQ